MNWRKKYGEKIGVDDTVKLLTYGCDGNGFYIGEKYTVCAVGNDSAGIYYILKNDEKVCTFRKEHIRQVFTFK